jgi:MscS family membrane protein
LLSYWKERAEESETVVDDILLPFVNIIAPIIIFVIGGLISLQVLGFNILSLTVIISAGSFILALALQAPLTNIFSGISLIMDTPFALGDIIILSDNTICQVVQIGLRVTELYNMANHSTIFVPNSKMAGETLGNITRPTPDLKAWIIIGIEQTPEALKRAPDLLLEIARANPYILGDGKSNLEAMNVRKEYIDKRIASGADTPEYCRRELSEIEWGMKMIGVQNRLYEEVQKLHYELKGLSWLISKAKVSDLNGEALSLEELYKEAIDQEAFDQEVLYQEEHSLVETSKKKQARGSPDGRGLSAVEKKQIVKEYTLVRKHFDAMLSGMFKLWVEVRGEDPNLREVDKTGQGGISVVGSYVHKEKQEGKIRADANRRIKKLIRRLEKLEQKIINPNEVDELRLNALVDEFDKWIAEKFLDSLNDWQRPIVSFDSYGDYTFNLKLTFFIDDIYLEKFARINRVPSDLRRRITERLTDEGIKINPNPTQIVSLQDGSGKLQSNNKIIS